MKKVISVSIEEEILKRADKIVSQKIEYSNRSNLIEILILKEFKRIQGRMK